MDLTVYTVVFGHTDPLHEQPSIPGVRFLCYTDQNIKSDSWEIIKIPKQDRPTRSARLMKTLSHLFVETEWSLWMDANFTLQTTNIDRLLIGDFVNFIHRDRTRISDEAMEIVRLGKGKRPAIFGQLEAYQAEGFDTDENPQQELSCNGVILRRHTDEVILINEAWADEIETHSLRDQMSLDYVAWKRGVELTRWPGTFDRCRHFSWKYYKRPTNDY